MRELPRRCLGQASCIAAFLALCAEPACAADPQAIAGILDAFSKVHNFTEVAISPDGRRVIYGETVTGRRDGADVTAGALWIANAKDGGDVRRLTACSNSACDEHGAAWSPDGRHIAFVTTGETGQPQIAVSDSDGGGARDSVAGPSAASCGRAMIVHRGRPAAMAIAFCNNQVDTQFAKSYRARKCP